MPSLEVLLADPTIDLVAVYTQPDRPAGRGRKLTPSPVKRRALAAGCPVIQPSRLAHDATLAEFRAFQPELLVVAAYGLILPAAVLEAARYPLNVHASLLPRWRGAAPIQRAIMAGDTTTGISIMRIVQRLDAGPVWLQRTCPISAADTGGSLHDRLATLGGAALRAALVMISERRISETPQDERAVTYAAKLEATDRDLDWSGEAMVLARQVRALAPLPGARARVLGVDCKVLEAHALDARPDAAVGTVLGLHDGHLHIATAAGVLALARLQPAGKQPMSATAFANGYGVRP